MTQGILDYLLIKTHFILCTEEEILNNVKDEQMLEIYCDIICGILETENFFYTDERIMKKLETFVSEKRFEGRHKNETIVDFNIMIDAINRYKKLSTTDKMINIVNWIDEEAKVRDLPFRRFPGYNLEAIYNCIKNESYYLKMLLQDNSDIVVYNPTYVLTTINLLCNRYPQVIEEDLMVASRCCASVLLIEDASKKHYYKRMVKKTLKNLGKVTKNIKDEDIDNYQKVIKKTEN